MPLVTVAIPTYQRAQFLRRAVESVLRQTYPHWELVVSDDEVECGEAWDYLSGLAKQDERVRVFKNPGPHGQVGNTNHVLAQVQGEWIKLLHDDDVLKPNCLEELIRVSQVSDNVACITCGVERFEGGKLFSSQWRSGWPLLEVIPQADVLTVMYCAENTGGAMPSQKMIHRRVLEQGVGMEQVPGLRWMVDSWFNVKIAECGDLVIYREPLVEWHQGDHITETNALSDAEKGAENMLFRNLLWEKISDHSRLPPPSIMNQMMFLQQAVLHVKQRRWQEGWALLRKAKHPYAYWVFLFWVVHNIAKGRLSRGTRTVIRTLPPKPVSISAETSDASSREH